MKFSYYLGMGRDWGYEEMRAVAREVERLGFDGIFHQDNMTGHHPIPRDMELFTPWIVLSALAEATSTIRLGSLVTPAPRRYAPLLAKDVASLDVISGGRVTVGLGAGDDVVQYASLGQPFPERRERLRVLRESIEAMKLLWSGERVSFDGDYVKLADAQMRPRPVQRPHPPVWIAGNTSRAWTPHLAADVADAYCIMWGEDEAVKRGLEAFRTRWEENGRPPEEMVAARVLTLLMSPPEVDVIGEVERLTGFEMRDYSEYASEADVPEGSDPAGYVFGHPDEIAAEVRRRSADMGFNHLILHFQAFGFELETDGLPGWAGNAIGSLRLFADRIWPQLEDLNPRVPAP